MGPKGKTLALHLVLKNQVLTRGFLLYLLLVCKFSVDS